jgi:hypothetical protein
MNYFKEDSIQIDPSLRRNIVRFIIKEKTMSLMNCFHANCFHENSFQIDYLLQSRIMCLFIEQKSHDQ